MATAMLLAGTVLVGCAGTPSPHHSAATAAPSPTPIFTSDEEALAAAVAVYKKYESISDAIGRDGGAHPERIRPYVSESGYQHEKSEADALKSDNAHGVGSSVLNNAILESRDEVDGAAIVTIYVCEDISAVARVDANGQSLTDPDRGNYFDYEVVLRGDARDALVIQSNTAWTGGGICKF